MVSVALTIAGSDPSGGAGIQADLKTFHQHGCYGCAVVTLLTVQNTRSVQRVEVLPGRLVGEQLEAVLQDMTPGAAKTGALGSVDVVEAVAERIKSHPLALVVDPVLSSKHGAELASEPARQALVERLLPLASLVTPNLDEASAISGRPVRTLDEARDAARAINDMGAGAVLIKGGHLAGDAVDVLCAKGEMTDFRADRIDTPHTHGVGCTLSAAITAWLSRGRPLSEAIHRAKAWLSTAIATSPGVGRGWGAVNHLAPLPDSMEE
jgi:hydroxymethylpyrimidine/phosphomethylpyrimidine kinase